MKKVLIIIGGLALVAFLWWTISPLFIDKEIDDALDTTMMGSDAKVSGPFAIVDTRTHPATGDIRIIESAGETIVRYENYDGTNGPDLYVYLAKDLDASKFVNLGRAKGNKGNINYTIPKDISIEEYPYVLTWCQAFGVLFDYARISE